MSDPRLNGSHLSIARHDQYDAAVDEMLDDRGPLTCAADVFVRSPAFPRAPIRREAPPPGGTYLLFNIDDGHCYPLRVGINALGRFPENDLVLRPNHVSRRHCIIVVHASGACEVFDTASRNGTRVNRRRIGRSELLPGDLLMICNLRFMVAWMGSDGEVRPTREEMDTRFLCGSSATG
jgi:hypothetical protein